MNPEKRFGQLEEVMAEMLQKQDRLEALAVQTFELAFNTDTKVDELRDEVNGRIDSLDEKLNGRIDSLDEKLNGRIDSLDEKLNGRIDTVARAVADLTVDNQREHQQINDKLDDLMTYLKAKLG
ncbi:MAG: hypothetical protein EAZ91_04020 [Cytophagales bacterium]|nr:MAG: hypothetical protein EAZ91_04020 [Cytophagales bacterium]